jgi:hypothetical protein
VVRVDECPKEVVVVIPRTVEDVRLIDHAGIDKVLEKEWVRRGDKRGAEGDGSAAQCAVARRSGAGVQCGAAATS